MIKIFSEEKKKKLLHIYFRYSKKLKSENLTPVNQFLQVSVFSFNEKKTIEPHFHLKHDICKIKKQIQESWVLVKGEAKIFYYDLNNKFLRSYLMKPGDISITFLGGHKLEVKKKGTILFEYKTGPYKGNTNDLKYFKKKNN